MAAGAVVALVSSLAAGTTLPVPPASWLVDHVKVLSAPEMAGRASGTPGAERAATHIARVLRDVGLRPGGDGGDFIQRFDVPTGISLGPSNGITIESPLTRLVGPGPEFMPLAASVDGDETLDVVFAGYGITAPSLGWDDYAGIDVSGKAVLVVAGDPGTHDPASAFRRPDAYHYSERSHKVLNARDHGARAVLLVSHPDRVHPIRPPSGLTQPSGIMGAAIAPDVADVLLQGTGTLRDLAGAIDRDGKPRSRALGTARVRVRITLVRQRGATGNVVGVLPGTDPRLRDEAVVIGAHYDHLGLGGEGSLAPERHGDVHAGADDNASGTASMMALAKAFAAAGGVPRTLVFVAFSGEEMGLLGSAHYVRHPAWPLDRTVAMLNLDMVGRLRDGKLYVAGVDSGTGLRQIVMDAARSLPLTPELRGDPLAPSDHTSFYTASRPVLYLFTGAHDDYHRPGDTWDKVNGAGLETIARFAGRLVTVLASTRTPPMYARIAAPAPEGRTSSRGYGPVFGIVPDFGSQPGATGVRVTGVRPASPAEKAGLQTGDVILRLGGREVKTIDDFTFVLRSQRPGDRVEVVVRRGDREERMEAVLEARQ
jgi:hypothetical protein